MEARVLVTGGAGFIGSHLTERLLAEGHAVRVLDNFDTGRLLNLAGCRADVDLVVGDVRDRDVVTRAVRGCETVFHLAAINSVPRSFAIPVDTIDVNVRGTLELVKACRRACVGRLIFASSSSVYGANPELPRRESVEPRPQSPYAQSKLAAERHCEEIGGPEPVILRYFNVYGPRQAARLRYRTVIPRFLVAARTGSEAVIFGTGRESRDFTFVDDVVEANILAMRAPSLGERRFNIGTGRSTTIAELADAVAQATGSRLAVRHEPPRRGDPPHSVADIGAARNALGYAPVTSLRDGLRRVVDLEFAAQVDAV